MDPAARLFITQRRKWSIGRGWFYNPQSIWLWKGTSPSFPKIRVFSAFLPGHINTSPTFNRSAPSNGRELPIAMWLEYAGSESMHAFLRQAHNMCHIKHDTSVNRVMLSLNSKTNETYPWVSLLSSSSRRICGKRRLKAPSNVSFRICPRPHQAEGSN